MASVGIKRPYSNSYSGVDEGGVKGTGDRGRPERAARHGRSGRWSLSEKAASVRPFRSPDVCQAHSEDSSAGPMTKLRGWDQPVVQPSAGFADAESCEAKAFSTTQGSG